MVLRYVYFLLSFGLSYFKLFVPILFCWHSGPALIISWHLTPGSYFLPPLFKWPTLRPRSFLWETITPHHQSSIQPHFGSPLEFPILAGGSSPWDIFLMLPLVLPSVRYFINGFCLHPILTIGTFSLCCHWYSPLLGTSSMASVFILSWPLGHFPYEAIGTPLC